MASLLFRRMDKNGTCVNANQIVDLHVVDERYTGYRHDARVMADMSDGSSCSLAHFRAFCREPGGKLTDVERERVVTHARRLYDHLAEIMTTLDSGIVDIEDVRKELDI